MPGPKLSVNLSPDATDEELLFARQLGVECVYTWVRDDQLNVASLTALRERVEASGLQLYNAGCYRLGKCDSIILGLPDRDEKIAEFSRFIEALGAAGIDTTTFTWEQAGVWSSTPGESRGAPARSVDLDELDPNWLSHDREYTSDEIWDNFAYYLARILPVCERAGVRLSLHPNDPPIESFGGVPCLIHSWADYRRAFELAGSPLLGMEFCCGCWLEGGPAFGNLLEGLEWCLDQGRVFIVHFRNVNATLPDFHETFLDNGYQDMHAIMDLLVRQGYEGTVILDHSPQMVGAPQSSTAYAIGYMRALREQAERG